MKKKELGLQAEKIKSGHSKEDREKIDAFFEQVNDSYDLPPVLGEALFHHCTNAFEWYQKRGKTVEEIITLLDPKQLGDHFREESRRVFNLDNAAIVYPLGMKHGQMPMFRLSATLKEEVVPEILQIAADFTIKRFPTFSAIVKNGFFWHYLETTRNLPVIEEEDDAPCKPISIVLRSNRSFRILVYEKRIAIEFFHVLTDGTGGMIFLKTLLGEYFRLLGKDVPAREGVLDIEEKPKEEEFVNEFEKAEGEDDLGTFIEKKSLQLDGPLSPVIPSHILHIEMDPEELKRVSRSYEGSITAYVLADMHRAAQQCISKKEGVFQIQVPVNMRKYHKSKTLRNFSMYFSTSLDINDHPSKEELVKRMKDQILERGDAVPMNKMMKTTGKIIHALRFVPLFLKVPVMQAVYSYLGNSIIGCTLSNLGVVKLPDELKEDVDHFDFLLSPGRPNRTTATLITYGNKARLSIIMAGKEKKFEEELLKQLDEDGISYRLEGSFDYGS